MNKFIKTIVLFFFLASTFGCANKSADISSAYVSPTQYNSLDCDQVGAEMQRVHRKVLEISGQQDNTATKDSVALGVGLVLFWPALIFMAGGDHKSELSRLKGEYEALDQAAIQKKCSLTEERKAIDAQVLEAEKKKIEESKAVFEPSGVSREDYRPLN